MLSQPDTRNTAPNYLTLSVPLLSDILPQVDTEEDLTVTATVSKDMDSTSVSARTHVHTYTRTYAHTHTRTYRIRFVPQKSNKGFRIERKITRIANKNTHFESKT